MLGLKYVKTLWTINRELSVSNHTGDFHLNLFSKLIYELAAEGIEGSLENEVFKYTSNTDEVISKLFEKIDQPV